MKVEIKLYEIVVQDKQGKMKYTVRTLRSIEEILADIEEVEKEYIKDKVEEAVNETYHAE